MPSRSVVNREQFQLFAMPPTTREYSAGPVLYPREDAPETLISQAEAPLTIDELMQRAHDRAVAEDVPMVNVLDRAEKIIDALTELGRISSINYGLSRAVDRQSGAQIWGRYRRGTTRVVENAQNKTAERYDTVRELLGSVAGYGALRTANPRIMGIRRINTEAKVDWGKFLDRFNGVDNRERRDEFRKKMRKQVTVQKKIRKRIDLNASDETGRV